MGGSGIGGAVIGESRVGDSGVGGDGEVGDGEVGDGADGLSLLREASQLDDDALPPSNCELLSFWRSLFENSKLVTQSL
jgi:hypothetical protein